ncbi:MAG: septum formation initiator family protein [Eubacterium sp.]|nr:septum formation initiator family protein [Eubacterium sp.]
MSYLVFLVIVGYAAFLLISTQIEISEKNAEYEDIHSQLLDVELSNERLSHYANDENRTEYIEEIARDKLGYAHPQEKIFYIVPSE